VIIVIFLDPRFLFEKQFLDLPTLRKIGSDLSIAQ
jgi:hypothetical protein